MIGEIIAIGDELTSGRITNTTSGFAARELFAAGHKIFAMHTIGDTPSLIGEALKRAIGRVEFVIVTGGLGSTTDDLTNEAVSAALDRPPTLHQEIMEKISRHLQGNRKGAADLEKLAWLPEGAEVLNSHARMAGYMLVHDSKPIFFLPGVPPQMKELMVDHVLPRLSVWSTAKKNHVRQRIYKTFGLPENEINSRLLPLEDNSMVQIGYYPVDSEVHVSLTVLGSDDTGLDALFTQTGQAIETALGNAVYGTGHDTPASVVGALLCKAGKQLSVAESCTGGLIGSKITEVPGSSDWFAGGVIAYSNELKETMLGVESELLIHHGAVSGPVARAMAARLADRTKTEMAVSVTGIAGPTGGSPEKPVGTVYIGLFHDNKVSDTLFHFSGSRKQIQEITAYTALDMIRRALL